MRFTAVETSASLGFGILLLAGCGGGQADSGLAPAKAQTTGVGNAVVTYSGQPKPMATSSSGSVTVAAMAGATFSSVRFDPPHNLASTYITFSRLGGGNSQIYKVPAIGGTEQILSHTQNGGLRPFASAYGQIYYLPVSASTVDDMDSDGTVPSALTITGAPTVYNVSVAPSGNILAMDTGSGLETVSAVGGTPTIVQAYDTANGNCWSPNGQSLAYCANNGSSVSNIFTTSATGGVATNIVPVGYQSEGWFQPSWSPDGLSVACALEPSGTSEDIVILGIGTSNITEITPNPTYVDYYPSFSPDGTEVAFYRTSTGGATPGIYVSNYSGTIQTCICPDTSLDGSVTGLNWSPFPASELLIGGPQFYSSSANGFLLAQNGSQFGSLTAFNVTTPSTAAVTTSATTGTQPLVYTISGDAITKIGYIDYYFNHGTTVTPPASTPSALVTIDANTGQVDMVVTAAVPAKQIVKSTAAGNLAYSGKFTALFDRTGKNLAPSGASRVVVDSQTGRLVTFN